MAPKYVVTNPPPSLRDHYTKAADGTYILDVEGHPDAARVAEFRTKNITLLQEVAKFEGIDPDAARAALAKVAAGDPNEVVTLKLDLAQEKSARAIAQAKADRGVLRDAIRPKAQAAGVIPGAMDTFLEKAERVFEVKDDVVKARVAGGPSTVDEWVLGAATEFPFLFGQSSGGGAHSRPPTLGAKSKANELVNPTPQQLGEHASDIASGKLKIVYST